MLFHDFSDVSSDIDDLDRGKDFVVSDCSASESNKVSYCNKFLHFSILNYPQTNIT